MLCYCTSILKRNYLVHVFVFQKPANLQLKPDYGPIAGGTAISIMGELLGDHSVSIILFLVDNLELQKYDV